MGGGGFLSEVHYFVLLLVYVENEIIHLHIDKDIVHHCPVSCFTLTLNDAQYGCAVTTVVIIKYKVPLILIHYEIYLMTVKDNYSLTDIFVGPIIWADRHLWIY